MESFKVIVALLTVVAVVYFLIKKYETKLVLFTAGVFMATVALAPMKAFEAFAKSMTSAPLIQAICSVLGFAAVLKITECDKHLINALGGGLRKAGVFLVPAAMLLTFTINIALPSAAGCAAAVGAIFIPLLIHSGVHPAMAAAAVFGGTYGSMLSPGLSHNAFVAEIAKIPVLNVINTHMTATIVSALVSASVLGILAVMLKEHKGYTSTDKDFQVDTSFKVNPIYALVNVVPLILLLVSFQYGKQYPALKIGVPESMLIGVVLAVLVTRKNPTEISKKFFDGMGGAYAEILGIIITATVFVAGLQALGAVDAFNKLLISNPSFASIGATVGPFLLAIVTGSGDAAAFAFNKAVTPLAVELGTTIERMGSLSALSGSIGRSMSPLAGSAIICAGFAKVATMELAKRTAPGMIMGLIAVYIILGF